MKCPLIEISWQIARPGEEAYESDCLKKNCAWWDSLYENCDPTGLAHTLERLTDTLAEIERKMPHKQQFRK